MKRKIVFFDFDGVIVDSFLFCYELAQLQIPHITPDEYRAFSNGNIYDVLKNVKRIPLDYFAHYTPRLLEMPTVNGIDSVISTLAKDYTLIIVSSTPAEHIAPFLKKHDLLSYFNEIYGSETHKSKEVKIKNALAKYSTEGKDAVMITDTLGDLREAAACGVAGIAVAWGFHTKESLAKGTPVAILNDAHDIPTAVSTVLN